VKTCLALGALTLSVACSLAAQVPLRPPPDTTHHPTWPAGSAFASKPRHSHPWLGAAIGAVTGGVIGYAAWRPCGSSWLCFGPSQGATAAIGAAAGAPLGWAIGSAITTEDRSRVPTPW
jgi:hypothetical protein